MAESPMLGTDENTLMAEREIVAAIEKAKAELVKAEVERKKLDQKILALREEQRLLERLLEVRKRGVGTASDESSMDERLEARVPVAGSVSKHPVVEAVIQELTAAGRPIHISDLMRLLRGRNVEIPGSGTQANLITYLRRDNRLVRPSRGMYGLTEWGLSNMPSSARRRRRTRIRRPAK